MPSSTDLEYGVPPPAYRLPDRTRVGRVRLQVSDLAQSVAYYRDVLGMHVLQQDATSARLAVNDVNDHLIELQQERGTRPISRGGILGLYHFAILVPSRQALGQFVKHLADRDVRFGAADHFVSEAIYLWDPDGLGIEVYADRPRDAWRTNGRELVMTTERLDLQALVEEAADGELWRGMPADTGMGHMHLSVGDLEEASRFFHRALGFDAVVWSYPGALFMSVGGYHHQLGTNTWAAGARTPSADDARLLHWELVLPSDADVAAAEASLQNSGYTSRDGVTVDPWGTNLHLIAASSAWSQGARMPGTHRETPDRRPRPR
jgi:catechol 2,3-dioxygenase